MITNLAINTEKPNMLNATMNEGAYELSSYCIDQVEKSTGECENWVSNNEKYFSIDLATYGNETNQTYYLHVKDIRGYIADSVGFDLSSSIFSITKDFEYKAEAQRYDIIADGTYKLEVWGAQGGVYQGGPTFVQEYNMYGNGATDVRIVNGLWSENTSLISRIMVAGAGGRGNGYILGKTYGASISQGDYGYAGGLYGYAGMVNKEQSSSHTRYVPYPGLAGTQISGGAGGINNYNGQYGTAGSFGKGGAGGSGANSWGSNTYTWSTGYGESGGWYGSGGSGGNNAGWWSAAGTGGGSSYISGHTGCVTVTSISSSSPKSGCSSGTTNRDCSKHPNGYVFNDTLMIDGAGFKWTNIKAEQVQMPNPEGGYYQLGKGHSGNGYARISTGEKDAIKIY